MSLVGFVLGWIGPWFEWSLVEMVLGLISPWLDQSCIGSIFVMTVKDSHLHQFTNMTLVYIFQVLEVLSSGLCRDNVRNNEHVSIYDSVQNQRGFSKKI